MKKYLPIMILIAALAVLAYGLIGSSAWFSIETRTTGSISSGNFDLDVTGGPLDLQKLEPGAGYKAVGEFCLQNNGDYDMKLRAKLEGVTDPGNLRDYLSLKLVLKKLNTEDGNNYGGEHEDIVLFSDLAFSAWMDWNDNAKLLANEGDVFAPGLKSCYKLYAQLSGDAGNDQVQKPIDFDLLINATQLINPGW